MAIMGFRDCFCIGLFISSVGLIGYTRFLFRDTANALRQQVIKVSCGITVPSTMAVTVFPRVQATTIFWPFHTDKQQV
jgi:hypothetical protein